jgi:hypothetical protein
VLPGEQPVRSRRVYQCDETGLWHLTSAAQRCPSPGELWIEKMHRLSELQLPAVDRANLDWQEYRFAVAAAILCEIRRRRDFFRFPTPRTISLRYTVNQEWVNTMRGALAEMGWLRYDLYTGLWITRPTLPKRRD